MAKKSGFYIYTELRPWAFVLSSGSSLHYIVTFYLFNYLLTGVNVFTERVKGGISLRNGMWHGLRNDIIMWNVIYAE